MSDNTPKDRVPVRRVPADPPQPYVTEVVTPKRDIFPYLMGALLTAIVLGLGFIVFILGSGPGTPGATVPGQTTNFPTEVPTSPSNAIPPAQPTTGAGSSASPVVTIFPTIPVGSRDQDVPRISMDDFKLLYSDTARRPIIIDVRTKSGYDAGHITGSINFPEDQMATLVSDLPKDKLVIAYCS